MTQYILTLEENSGLLRIVKLFLSNLKGFVSLKPMVAPNRPPNPFASEKQYVKWYDSPDPSDPYWDVYENRAASERANRQADNGEVTRLTKEKFNEWFGNV